MVYNHNTVRTQFGIIVKKVKARALTLESDPFYKLWRENDDQIIPSLLHQALESLEVL